MAANDNKVVVQIVGDASGVQPAVDLTGESIESLVPIVTQLNESILALTAQMKEGFAAGAASAHQMAASITETRVAAEGAGAGLGGMVMKIHEGAESVRTFQMRAKEFAEVYVALFAVDRIGEFINKMGEASEKVTHLAEQFGMSVGQVQQLQGIAAATGVSVDVLTKGMGILDRNLATVATGSRTLKIAFDQVGVSINDGRSQMEKLAVIADKFKNMDDGPKKAALAMQLFGRSGREMIPVLDLGSAGIEQLNQKMKDYGVVNEDAVAKGTLLAENVNETKVGFEGMWNVLTQALAPAFSELVAGFNELIQSFIQSYQQGGTVAIIFAVIADAVKIAIAVIEDLGQIFGAVWTVISEVVGDIVKVIADCFGTQLPKNTKQADAELNVFKDVLTVVKDAVLEFVDAAGGAFRSLMETVITFAKVANDALHLRWGEIAGDWNAGMAQVASIVHEYAGKIEADAAEMGAAIAAAASGKALGPDTSGLDLPKAGGDFDYDPSAGAKKKKQKKPKDDLVQKLQEALQAKKDAWNEEQLAQDTAQEYSLQSEADYWKQYLNMAGASAKDRQKIEEEYIKAEQAVQKQEIEEKLDGFKEELKAAGNNWTAKKAVLEQEQAYIVRMYGAQSKEARAASEQVIAAKQEEAKQIRQLQDEIATHERQLELISIAEAESDAKQRVAMGVETKGQLLQQEKAFEDQRYAIQVEALQKEKALLDRRRDPIQYQKICDQIELLEKQHQQKLSDIDRQAVLERTQIERNAVDSITQGWTQQISKLVTLQQGFSATMKGLYQALQTMVAQVLDTILAKFIETELLKIIYGKATAQAQVGAEAAKAGAGGVASMAAAPWPLDMTAPAFGAAMSAAALAAGSINIAEGGDWQVSEGLYMLHRNEMVLPAWAANPLRSMVSSGQAPANFNAPASANDGGGDMHVHFHAAYIDRRGVESFFKDNRHAVGMGAKAYARYGGSLKLT